MILKKYVLVFCMLALITQLDAQISLVSGDMPLVNDTIYTASDTQAVGMTIGSSGANVTWDFSGASADENTTTYVQDPAATVFAANFPNSNLAITTDFANYVYVNLTAQAYSPEGLTGDLLGVGLPLAVELNPTYNLYRFPTQYGNAFAGNYGFTETIPAGDLPPALLADIEAQLPAGVTLLQVRGTYTSDFTDTIDAWGTTITPICSYNSLRQKRIEDIHLVVDAQVSFFGFPSWVNVVDSMFSTLAYNWLAKETKLPLVTVELDNASNVTSVTYSLIPPALVADFSGNPVSICPGESVDFIDESEGCPDSWLWTFTGGTPGTSNIENPLGIVYNVPGNYPVTLEVTKGGTSEVETKTSYITVNTPPLADAGANDTICIGDSGVLSASGGISYQWSTGASTQQLTDNPLTTSSYTVTVTDANGCTASDNASIVVNGLPVAEAGMNDTVCLGSTGTLVASGGASYMWSNGSNAANLTDNPASTTIYTVTVTDVNGCSNTDDASIIILSLPNGATGDNDTICKGETGLLLAAGGASYLWSNGNNTPLLIDTPVASSNYSVTITGGNGCTVSDNATIVVNPLPIKTLSDQSICVGSVTVLNAGNPNSGYSWNTGATGQTISVNTGGDFSVTITDVNGCVNSDTANVTVGVALTVNLSDQEICQDDLVTLDAGNPGTDHLWSTGDTTQTIMVGTAGVYSVTVTDLVGCTGGDSSTVMVNALPIAEAGDNDTICLLEGGSLVASGGTFYEWSNGGFTAVLIDSPTTTTLYTVTVTDANSCSSTDISSIVVNDLPAADAGVNDTICLGETGSLAASGGISYVWSSGESTANISDDPQTTETYSVTVTNGDGCSASDVAQIVVNALPIADAGLNDSICFGDTALLVASGGGSYLWNNSSMNDSLSVAPMLSTTYYVTVENVNGCTANDSVEITVLSLPVVSFVGLDSNYCPNDSVSLLVGSLSGGIFSGNGITGDSFDPSQVPGSLVGVTYSYENEFGCASEVTKSANVFDLVDAQFMDLESSYCLNEAFITLMATPSGGVFSGPGVSGSHFDPMALGVGGPFEITYEYTDSTGCVFTVLEQVSVDTLPSLSIFGLDSIYCVDDDPVMLVGSPPGGFFSGAGVTGNEFDPSGVSVVGESYIITYSLVDSNGCSNLAKANVTVDECTGLDQYNYSWSIKAYPNPADDNLFVQISSQKELAVHLTLYDITGKSLYDVKSTNPGQRNFLINTSGLQSGMYYLEVVVDNSKLIEKVLIQR